MFFINGFWGANVEFGSEFMDIVRQVDSFIRRIVLFMDEQ